MAWEHAFSQHMLDLALSEEDVEELRSERSIKHAPVTSEEIEELSVDENLSPYDRLVYVLSGGRDVQKVHAIGNMYNILKEESKESIEKVLLIFKEILVNASKEVQIVGAKFLLEISVNRLINGERFASHFSKDLLNSVKNKDPEICEGWISAFIGSLNIIPKRYINEVVIFLKSSGSLRQPMNIRLLCGKMVAHVCKFVDSKRLMSEMIPVMRSLCQDIDLDVRACMCGQLVVLASFLSDDAIREFLIPELSLLLQDEETNVRLVALESLKKILAIVHPDLIATRELRTIILTFYSKAVEKCIISEVIGCAHFIGEIICCEGFLNDGEKVILIRSYKCLCSQGIVDGVEKNETNLDGIGPSSKDGAAECRYWCSYNFPAVLVSAMPDQISSELLPSFLLLIRDPHPAVRKPLAYSFHEIARLLTDDLDVLFDALLLFLNDKDIDILHGIVTGLPCTFQLLFNFPAAQNYYFPNIFPTLLECEQYLSQSLRWRVHKTFIENMYYMNEFLSCDQVHLKLVPILTSILTGNKVIPVKLAAGYTMLRFMKQNTNIEERNEICSTFETELAHSRSKALRVLYLDLCHYVPELFSKSFFKEKFYSAAMELASDAVVNVRLKFCETLPLLKSQIRLPCDRLLLQTLEQTVRRIMAMESDRDISNAIRQAITDMDCVRLSMDGTPQTDEDMTDLQKEKEEESLMEEYIQRKTDSFSKLLPKDRQGSSSSYIDKGSRRSLTSDDSADKILPKTHQRLSKSGSGTKLSIPKRASVKHGKDGQTNKPGKSSNVKSQMTKR